MYKCEDVHVRVLSECARVCTAVSMHHHDWKRGKEKRVTSHLISLSLAREHQKHKHKYDVNAMPTFHRQKWCQHRNAQNARKWTTFYSSQRQRRWNEKIHNIARKVIITLYPEKCCSCPRALSITVNCIWAILLNVTATQNEPLTCHAMYARLMLKWHMLWHTRITSHHK